LKSKKPSIKVVLLDPVGSIYFKFFKEGIVDPAEVKPYFVEGVGEDHLAKCMNFSVISDVMQFDDENAFATCQELASSEGLLCGGSSGANVWGCVQLARAMTEPGNIVTVLPDSGIKYMSKIFNEAWLAEHNFGLKRRIPADVA
jgi:cystathionine beta-synthase/cysteine synthase A